MIKGSAFIISLEVKGTDSESESVGIGACSTVNIAISTPLIEFIVSPKITVHCDVLLMFIYAALLKRDHRPIQHFYLT